MLQEKIKILRSQIAETEKLIEESHDEVLLQLAREDMLKLGSELSVLETSLALTDGEAASGRQRRPEAAIPPDPHTAILEIRAGTGGTEAALFAQDLYRMYIRYAQKAGWKVELIAISNEEPEGIKTVVTQIRGENAYTCLKNESGVHRVQRVPATESGGRIHTSAASVAVLPKVSPIQLEIKPEDVKIDFYRSGGHGGQNVNKVSTAARLTHLPTGLIVESQQERSQIQNREKGMELLRARLFDEMQKQQVLGVDKLRADQIGSGDRSEKIRTYNFPQNRVTDHRIDKSWSNIEKIMDGDLAKIFKDYPLIRPAQQESV